MADELRDSVIVVTGASSGIGKGTAMRLADQGASLVLAARRGSLLEGLALQCEGKGGICLPVEADISQREDVEFIFHEAIRTFDRIDVWINNAGVAAIGRYEDTPLEDHMQVIATDLLGTMFGSFFALQQFRKQSYGTLINVASVLGKFPAPYYASYSAAKHGVVGLSAALRQEIRQNHDDKIHVCTLLPMPIDTPFFEHASNYTGHETKPATPVNDPEQVIEAILQLVKNPADEVIVGAGGQITSFAHHLFPSLVEGMIATQTHQAQIEQAPLSTMTTGGVRQPLPTGIDVTGGHLDKS